MKASASTATSSPEPVASPQGTAPRDRSNPMAAYTPDVVGRYDAKSACLAGCAAALRCRSELLYGGGSSEVGTRLRSCRSKCAAHSQSDGYLGRAATCLSSGTCDAFEACASGVLPTL